MARKTAIKIIQIPTFGLDKPAVFVISYFYFDKLTIFSFRTLNQLLFISQKAVLNFSGPKIFVKLKQVKLFNRYDITKTPAVVQFGPESELRI